MKNFVPTLQRMLPNYKEVKYLKVGPNELCSKPEHLSLLPRSSKTMTFWSHHILQLRLTNGPRNSLLECG